MEDTISHCFQHDSCTFPLKTFFSAKKVIKHASTN